MLRWTTGHKIGFRYLFGKRLVPVSQVDYLVRNEELFTGQRYRRMEDQKLEAGSAGNQDFAEGV